MALEDVVQLTITRQSRPLERAGFGTMLYLSMHRAWSDRIKYYTKAADMLDDGFGESDSAYRAAVTHFLQEPKPEQIAIGRLAVADATVIVVDDVEDAHVYTVWLDGIGFDYIAGASTTTTLIEAGLTTVINSGYTVTAASSANKTFTIAGGHVASFPAGGQFRITGSGANNGTYTVVSAAISSGSTVITVEEAVPSTINLGVIKSLVAVTATNSTAWDGAISISPDVASTFFACWPGEKLHIEFDISGTMATNLAAIETEDATGWYAVALAHQWEENASPAADNTQVDLEYALATAIESRRKIFIVASPETDIVDVTLASDDATTGSIAKRVKAAGYARTAVLYSAQADDGLDDVFADAAWLGARLPFDPGTETWSLTELTGVTADELTTTQRTNALAKNANIFTPFTADRAIVEEGTVADGEYIDVVRLADAIYDAVVTEVGTALLSPRAPMAKVPFTDDGIAAIEAAIRRALDTYTGPRKGLSDYRVTVPLAEDVSDTDRGNRALTGVSFVGTLTGAVHTVEITGNVTV